MKKFIFTLLLSISVTSSLFSQTSWISLGPFPTEYETINKLTFINLNTGYIVTYSGSYFVKTYKTTNSGFDWFTVRYTTLASRIGDLFFLNDSIGFYSQLTAGLYKTINGGFNWTYKSYNYSHAMTFLNNLTGYGVCGSEFGGILQKTIDGGDMWNTIYQAGIPGNYIEINDIKFFNSNVGILCGESRYLMRTTNAGINWSFVYPSDYGIFYSISLIDNNTGIVVGNGGKILRTTNQGLNWIDYSPSSSGNYQKIQFTDNNTGYISSKFDNTLIKTTNSGLNWFQILNGVNCEFFKFFDNNTGYIYRGLGNLLKTSNGGTNWYDDNPVDNFKSIFMININTGYSGGANGNLYKTINGISNINDVKWKFIHSFGKSKINDIYFLNDKNGFILSDSGKIFATTDSANNWITINTTIDQNLNKISFLNENNGFAVGNQGFLLKTTNSGLNWSQLYSGYTFNIKSISIVSDNILYVCGDSSLLLKSENGGTNWSSINLYNFKQSNSVDFKNINTGIVVGDSGKTYKTTNGGLNWIFQRLLTSNADINFVKWFRDSSVCAIGNGFIKISTNNGFNWGNSTTDRLYQANINQVQFVNDNVGYFCGNKGMIQRTMNGGGNIVDVNNTQENTVTNYHIFQNSPNPFNPLTKIKFDITKLGLVRILVYDILGREVQTLVNERLQPGTYETTFEGSSLNSGVYFYKIVTDGYSETKKMLLIK